MTLSPVEILARCPLFAQLDLADIDALAAIGQREHFSKDSTVFLANDPVQGLHVVASGVIKVYMLSPQSGREIILTTEHPYRAVAELPSFDGGPYPANAQALEDSQTLFLPQAAFERVLRERPTIALHLLRTLGGRLRRLVGLIEQLSFQEVVHRLAAYLLERAHEGLPAELETNAVIAARLGTVPELVSRNLSRLQQSDAIRLEGRRIAWLDEVVLADLAAQTGR